MKIVNAVRKAIVVTLFALFTFFYIVGSVILFVPKLIIEGILRGVKGIARPAHHEAQIEALQARGAAALAKASEGSGAGAHIAREMATWEAREKAASEGKLVQWLASEEAKRKAAEAKRKAAEAHHYPFT